MSMGHMEPEQGAFWITSDGVKAPIPPGRCFRMLMIGYFEGICSERGLA